MAAGFANFCSTFLILAAFSAVSKADTPANCTYPEIQGTWQFFIGEGNHDNSIKCDKMGEVRRKLTVTLMYPDLAQDEFGNQGFWTLVYNQGFEVVIDGRKYFAFSKYNGSGAAAVSYCDQTMPGWSHDVLGHDWACFMGHKVQAQKPKKSNYDPKLQLLDSITSKQLYRHNPDFISEINAHQSTWRAVHYPEHEKLSLEQLTRRAGGTKSSIHGGRLRNQSNLSSPLPRPAPVHPSTARQVSRLPDAFDWRNVSGVNYVTEVRNQGSCGSCFAFASAGMNECRLRVMSRNKVNVQLSPQDVVECSLYSQGCDGGFPYLIGGKYAEDFGMVEEQFNPYKGKNGPCTTPKSTPRRYATNYKYVGGFYGACNEPEMRLALVNNGPLAVSFEVYPDFRNYRSGVYVHTGLRDKFNPFMITNHVVVLVGYGTDSASGVPYWLVRNSWGNTWGENGYFRIRRGTDECSIESIAVESFPIL